MTPASLYPIIKNLNLNLNYVPTWTADHAFREFAQNWLVYKSGFWSMRFEFDRVLELCLTLITMHSLDSICTTFNVKLFEIHAVKIDRDIDEGEHLYVFQDSPTAGKASRWFGYLRYVERKL